MDEEERQRLVESLAEARLSVSEVLSRVRRELAAKAPAAPVPTSWQGWRTVCTTLFRIVRRHDNRLFQTSQVRPCGRGSSLISQDEAQ